jgi:RpiB/LacA/LacB family sugar-phosphate isomerase
MNKLDEKTLNEIVEKVVASLSSVKKGNNIIAIGADHGGFHQKQFLLNFLEENGYEATDCGTYSTESVDYPDIAKNVADKVVSGQALFGILIDGAGIGSCMAANKVKGARAANCWNQATANNAREHNNANILSLGSGMIGNALASKIVLTFLKTDFAGGRHARRVEKIMEIEK